jgi:hypothetical protein
MSKFVVATFPSRAKTNRVALALTETHGQSCAGGITVIILASGEVISVVSATLDAGLILIVVAFDHLDPPAWSSRRSSSASC